MDIESSSAAIDALIRFAQQHLYLEPTDEIWARNQLLAAVGLDSYASAGMSLNADDPDQDDMEVAPHAECPADQSSPSALLNNLTSIAQKTGVLDEGTEARLSFEAHVMNLLMPRPSQVKKRFQELVEDEGIRNACDYLYRLSADSLYVHEEAAARDIRWATNSPWGELEVSINRSKPEKDPRDIARALESKNNNAASDTDASQAAELAYPECQLCTTNEGYAGRNSASTLGAHPARQNLRLVDIPLGEEIWNLQFSPYSYYEQHCIVLNPKHVPMKIDRQTFDRLTRFCSFVPHYFIGSNADLPIVGGSILTHDHYQAGHHVFPMDKASVRATFSLPKFEQVACSVIKWPLTVIRLESQSREQLVDAAAHVLDIWKSYDDPSVGVISSTNGVRHNTVTPIARLIRTVGKDGKPSDDVSSSLPCSSEKSNPAECFTGNYRLDLALRCNITDEAHPYGVFHPDESLHHIKKENIGLIEVMGLAILPGRLASELSRLEQLLCEECSAEKIAGDPLVEKHAPWANDVVARHPELSAGNVRQILQDEVGDVFCKVLECCGVFKYDDKGTAALGRFLAALQ